MRPRPPGTLLALLLLLAPGRAPAAGAGEPLGHSGMLGPYPMDREASGTSWQPEAAGMEGVHLWAGPWRVMLHAWAFGLATRQGGPRGGEEGFSTNMAMAAASRTAAGGTFTARAMVSLEPLMGPDGYRLLLQTGETGNGRTNLIDRQHPHDLFMEMAVAWSHPIRGRGSVFAYAGWPGEPAVGPPVFMHRASGAEIPVAPIAHHWLDATHISFGTATAGLVWGRAKLEASAFNGHEPDARRWNLERPRFDSSAARLTINPWPWLSAQLSAAQLRSPERLHPAIDVRRYTASLAYSGAWGRLRPEVTLAWGRNVRSATVPAACPLGTAASELVATCFTRSPLRALARARRADGGGDRPRGRAPHRLRARRARRQGRAVSAERSPAQPRLPRGISSGRIQVRPAPGGSRALGTRGRGGRRPRARVPGRGLRTPSPLLVGLRRGRPALMALRRRRPRPPAPAAAARSRAGSASVRPGTGGA